MSHNDHFIDPVMSDGVVKYRQMFFEFKYDCTWLFKSVKTDHTNKGTYWLLLIVPIVLCILQQLLKSLKNSKKSPFHEHYKLVSKKQDTLPDVIVKFAYQALYLVVNGLLMLLIMTFNGGIFIACMIGYIIGYRLFNFSHELSGQKCHKN